MALKNLFDMVKADRYTADGREALIKAQEAETEDKVYQIGEISQKTGLQKTANGWVKPKSGKQPGAKKENPTRTFEFKAGPDGMPVAGSGKEVKTYKTKKEAEAALKKQNAAAGSKPAAENKTTIRQGLNTKTLNETPAEHIKKNWDYYAELGRYGQEDMEQLVLSPSGYKETDSYSVMGGGKRVQYEKEGGEKIALFFDKDGELDDYEIEGPGSKPAETKTYKTSDIERVDKNNLKLGEVTATKEADGVWSVKNAKGEEVARALSVDIARESMVKSANRKPGESKYPNVSTEEKIKKLAEYFRSKYGKTTEEWSKTLEKSPEETLEDQYEEYAKKHPTDAAPRVLTDDTKIRVRKA